MNEQQIKKNAKEFATYWADKGYEKGESQPFWLALLRDVLGVEHPEQFISFEEQVHLDHTSFIDGMIPATHVMIEQKSANKDLNAAIKQSDGSMLNPFQQAKRYSSELPYSDRPRYIVTCNFREFYIYDMEKPQGEPEILLLKDLPKEYYRLQFLVNTENADIKREVDISKQAGELIGEIYDAFATKYHNPMSEAEMQSLNVLCVRLVFCMYAEDAEVFNRKQFQHFVESYNVENLRGGLLELFKVLDTKTENRDPYMAEKLAAFPYVNGGLFANENIIIPQLDEKIVEKIIKACEFDWRPISPTIFGAVFESTLNPETRRKGGMHYTSIENIHKVIDPLFLNDLREELTNILAVTNNKQKREKLTAYQSKLSGLKFLDPACGSGNFLTETYISLRRLENEVLRALQGEQIVLGELAQPIQVKINQFYGIEINDFAVTVAKTALWIAESQMMQETKAVVAFEDDFLPLKTNAYIVEGNALRIDWNTVVPAAELNYIMGNPPFVGTKYQSPEQKEDILALCPELKSLDYVTGWYKKANDHMANTKIRCAFVSTNSITQGEQVAPLWKVLNVQIIFAYRTFVWDSESTETAHVHVVIIGFTCDKSKIEKKIYTNAIGVTADNINGYLFDAPDIVIEARKSPIQDFVPKMVKGSQPTDGGHLLLDENERNVLLTKYPLLKNYIKRYMGANDLINNDIRYCLWLKDCKPNDLSKMPMVLERIELVKKSRLDSKKEATRKWADRPYLFTEDRQPNKDYMILPVVSSGRRKYMPIGYVVADVIANANAQMIPGGDLYAFGILISNVHNAWLRAVCGRMKSDYAYSATIVYNNFPWPECTDAQKAKIEQTAQAILDARALYPDSSLADLYDELTMPSELRKAHQANDRAVMEAYGFDWRNMTESQCVAELMKLYQELVNRV